MNDSDFQTFCYEEYKRSLSSADDIYRRYPLAVTAIVVLVTATIAVGSNRHLPYFLVRVDVTLYYLGIALALLASACSTSFLLHSVFPKDYEQLESTIAFHEWREAYRKSLAEKGFPEETIVNSVATSTAKALTLRFVQATAKNIETDRARTRGYNRAMYAIGVAVVSLGLAAAFSWVIELRGLTTPVDGVAANVVGEPTTQKE